MVRIKIRGLVLGLGLVRFRSCIRFILTLRFKVTISVDMSELC